MRSGLSHDKVHNKGRGGPEQAEAASTYTSITTVTGT
jgi:hypothetical protein